jgi:hypothetical protein
MASSGARAASQAGRPSGSAEAAAEARDGLTRFGPARAKELLELAEKSAEVAFGAGGASQSVYRIAFVSPDSQDTTSAAFALRRGLISGVRHAAGAWFRRFHFQDRSFPDSEVMSRFAVREFLQAGAGVMLVTGGDATFTAAAAGGTERRVVVIDARGNDAMSVEPVWSSREAWRHLPSTQTKALVSSGGMGPFIARPSPCDQARALARAVAARTEVGTIAIALPSSRGSYGLAKCFQSAIQAIGRKVVEIEYEPGRRDFTPEARRFRDANAQAILLAGPAEESQEWLIALRKARLTPLVLGTSELDPSGMHDQARSAAEQVTYVGSEWEFVRADEERRALAAAEQDGFGGSADYRRGFRLGQILARTVVDGAFTPSRLYLELESKSRIEGEPSPARLAGDDARDRLPLFVIRNGASTSAPAP